MSLLRVRGWCSKNADSAFFFFNHEVNPFRPVGPHFTSKVLLSSSLFRTVTVPDWVVGGILLYSLPNNSVMILVTENFRKRRKAPLLVLFSSLNIAQNTSWTSLLLSETEVSKNMHPYFSAATLPSLGYTYAKNKETNRIIKTRVELCKNGGDDC